MSDHQIPSLRMDQALAVVARSTLAALADLAGDDPKARQVAFAIALYQMAANMRDRGATIQILRGAADELEQLGEGTAMTPDVDAALARLLYDLERADETTTSTVVCDYADLATVLAEIDRLRALCASNTRMVSDAWDAGYGAGQAAMRLRAFDAMRPHTNAAVEVLAIPILPEPQP